MAGSHEVRGSIPLCSTKFSTAVRRSFLCIGGSNPARVEQPSGLFKPEHGGSRAQGSGCPKGIRPIPLCSTTKTAGQTQFLACFFCSQNVVKHIPDFILTTSCSKINHVFPAEPPWLRRGASGKLRGCAQAHIRLRHAASAGCAVAQTNWPESALCRNRY